METIDNREKRAITLISLTLWRFLTLHFLLPSLFLYFVLGLHLALECFPLRFVALTDLLDQLLLRVDVHLQPLAQLLLVLQLQLLQLFGELGQQLFVLLVQQLLVLLHLVSAGLLQLGQGRLVVSPQSLVPRHLLVHLLLQVLLLLSLDDGGCPDGGKVLGVYCSLVWIEVRTDSKLARVDLQHIVRRDWREGCGTYL